ncbi:hypothetical protein EK21DRAFT_113809 [Setomelanomma holmii]|uniref:Uncharacterized protein n=1 Tax=Setomelanomma holmii TaxID=210430 RepID=A0A9P4LLA7_9PLEO|nr:hypothetical protein EK21DRAFT_113809 [Setomelanomma holmii]
MMQTLEKLLRSQSFVSAIGTAITLRSITTISVPLLLIWSLSPLGGQSSLRMLSEANRTIPDSGTVYYAHPEAPFNLNQNSSWFSVVPTALLASLAASGESREGPIDLWKHPKMPRLDKIELKTNDSDIRTEGEWQPVGSNHSYSSLLGINVQGLTLQTRSRMDVNHTYMTVDCKLRYRDNLTNVLRNLTAPTICVRPILPITNGTNANGTATDDITAGYTLRNTTVWFQDQELTKTNEFMFKYGFDLNSSNDKIIRCDSSEEVNIMQRIYFLYGQRSVKTKMMHVYDCTPRFYSVNARLDCRSDVCVVDRVRRIPNKYIGSPSKECVRGFRLADDDRAWRQLPCLATVPKLLKDFVDFLVMATTSYPAPLDVSRYSIFDDFILGGNETYPTKPEDRDLDNVSDVLMSQRLTLVLNAFWQAASWGPLTTRMDPFNKPNADELRADFKYTVKGMEPKGEISNTTATIEWTIPVYRANVYWCMTLLFTTGILISFAVLNLGMSCYTIAPDLFSYAASMTRGNPYTDIPAGGTALGGTERSRLLKNLKVQVADVRPGDDVGYVALRSVDRRSEFDRGRLRKGRMYE